MLGFKSSDDNNDDMSFQYYGTLEVPFEDSDKGSGSGGLVDEGNENL